MNNGWLDRALLMAILAAIGGLYWQMFSMNERLTAEIAEVRAEVAAVSERLARVETHLQYVVPSPTDPPPQPPPGG